MVYLNDFVSGFIAGFFLMCLFIINAYNAYRSYQLYLDTATILCERYLKENPVDEESVGYMSEIHKEVYMKEFRWRIEKKIS